MNDYTSFIQPVTRYAGRLTFFDSTSRMTEKAPAYQWYPKDYDTDEAVKLMTYEQEGIYRRLLDHQALHGSIPSQPAEIARLVPKVSPKRFLTLWPRIAGKFLLTGTRLVNPKLERVRAATQAYHDEQSENGKKGAAARWGHRAAG